MAPQDTFIDEEEDVCPLCIEEFDLSDRNFRPCPCGYQVCQFCFNNIKNNMNGLCPACRRPYDEKTIEWKVVTQEEVAQFRANIQKNQKKRVQEQRQKEVLKREAEKENRKNLVGVRVVQKNLVYITGLAPTVREDELLKTLRKPEFFGQYGNIQKISISNRKSPDGQHHSLGIYVTFETPDEAMRCIQAVHGSHNGDRVLKAQHVRSRRGSYATSGAASSPAVSASVPVASEKQEPLDIPEPSGTKASNPKSKPAPAENSQSNQLPTTQAPSPSNAIKALLDILNTCTLPNFTTLSGEETGPPMFDIRGGEKRKAMREDKDSRSEHDDQLELPEGSENGLETGGSLALGGEPEGRVRPGEANAYGQRHISPIQRSSTDGVFSPSLGGSAFGVGTSTTTPRSMTPQPMGLRSQAGYADQYPPGIGGPSNSFHGQGPGHNRQSSRFNFANESGASSTNVKLTANPRIMAQQSSMMPSSFQSQGSQFYASSMPGPPPGLKSTGTPPSMFAQGFGSSSYNVPKDNSNDLLQSLIGRNRGNNQSHESGKHDDLPSLADATSSVDALVADEADDLATPFAEYNTTTHSHGHPEPSLSFPSAGGSIVSHGHPSPEPSVRRPPPGFELRSPVGSKERSSSPMPAPPSKPEVIQKRPTLADEEFPALGSPKVIKGAATGFPTPKMALPNTVIQGKQAVLKKPDANDGPNDNRRGSLNNNVESDDKEKEPTKPATSTPRTGPRTLRVMTPAKIELPSVMSPVASRILSIGQRPETPASETVSDSASIVSASVSASRAGSPPPSRVGSAAVRTTTKSQQRKQRKDALKQDTKAIAETAAGDEADHAPVLGRKKKQKKEKPVREKAEKPAKETQRSTSGVPHTTTRKSEEANNTENGGMAASDKEIKSSESNSREKSKLEKVVEQTVLVPSPAQPPTPTMEDSIPDDEPVAPPQGPSTVFEDIRRSLWTTAIDQLNLLKPVAGLASIATGRQVAGSKPGACKDMGCKCGEIQPDDLAVLESGKPVRKQCRVDGSRMLITPNGDCVRRLTEQEEDDFLQLQAAVALTAETAGSFTAPRHRKSSGAFSIVKGRAVPNGRPNIFPVAARPEAQDPFGKLQRDEALSYINQYVLPRLNLGASGKAAATASGSLAPLRDAAAASLNSLAPYFYGPEAAAGVGIYSAVDSGSARPVHDFGAPPGLTLGGNVDMVKASGTRGVGAMALMSVEEAEAALAATRKDTEKLEKGLNAVIKRNRRLLIGSD
ncbi:hypothetical protein V2A60_009976 [Cordyceps javanica]